MDQLLYDLVGIEDLALLSTTVRAVNSRLTHAQVRTYVVRDAAFNPITLPELVPPQEIQRALDDLEEKVADGMHRAKSTLAHFAHLLLVRSPGEPAELIALVAGEIARRARRMPEVLAIRVETEAAEGGVTVVDAPALPLKWRCQQGETVILAEDVWLEGEDAQVGTSPALVRGQALTIVERSVYDGEGLLSAECFLTVTTLTGQDTPFPLILPWRLVAHPAVWGEGEPARAPLCVVAAFRLPCWYAVHIEPEPDERVSCRPTCSPGLVEL